MNPFIRSLLPLLLLGSAGAVNMNAPVLPDARMTPGDVLTTDLNLICTSGYTKTVRNVPVPLKQQIYQAYGVTQRDPGEYEIDHLVALELGGSNSVRNLWPQSFRTMPLNAHVKDDLENALHEQLCSRKITVQEAQQAIASNWTQAYTKYVGPLPGGARAAQQNTAGTRPSAPAVPAQTRQASTVSPVGAPGSTPPAADGSCPASAPVKVSRAGVFHLPQGDRNYANTHAKSCYATPAAATTAGFQGIR